MRCLCCGVILSDYEATRRHKVTGEYLDLCSECLGVIQEHAPLPYFDRPELLIDTDSNDTETTKESIDNENDISYPKFSKDSLEKL